MRCFRARLGLEAYGLIVEAERQVMNSARIKARLTTGVIIHSNTLIQIYLGLISTSLHFMAPDGIERLTEDTTAGSILKKPRRVSQRIRIHWGEKLSTMFLERS
jgi:hypothetical protein